MVLVDSLLFAVPDEPILQKKKLQKRDASLSRRGTGVVPRERRKVQA